MSGMNVSGVTVGLHASDLASSIRWYQRVLQLSEPDLEPADGVVEFKVGPVWLQLGEEPADGPAPAVTRFGVENAGQEQDRLLGLGLAVGPLEHVPGAVDYFDFTDPDGNVLSVYSEINE
jgi:predicted enzyme related to lactoylglutathione lyase